MNGREVFKFATRVLVSSAEAAWSVAECRRGLDVTFRTRKRGILDHAVQKLGIPGAQ